jgi:recombination associated protein RdgC
MWFKNLAVYRFSPGADYPCAHVFEDALGNYRFNPVNDLDLRSMGFVPPLVTVQDRLILNVNNKVMFACDIEERILPAATVNTQLQIVVAEIEEREARRLPKKERAALKDAVIAELLPKAFTKKKRVHGYWDMVSGWLVIDSASTNVAEDILSLLRKGLGTLPVTPLYPTIRPEAVLTQWLIDGHSADELFNVEQEGELRAPEEKGAILRYKRQDTDATEVTEALHGGKEAYKLELTWCDRVNFTLDAELRVKRLKFLEFCTTAAAEIEAENEIAVFKADFVICSETVSALLGELSNYFVVAKEPVDEFEEQDDALG